MQSRKLDILPCTTQPYARPSCYTAAMISTDRDGTLIDEDRVRALARLARLELPDEEIQQLTGDLGKILAHVEQLQELNLEGVDPTAHIGFDQPALRADSPEQSLPVDDALREAPRVSMEGFAVPSFVDEG